MFPPCIRWHVSPLFKETFFLPYKSTLWSLGCSSTELPVVLSCQPLTQKQKYKTKHEYDFSCTILWLHNIRILCLMFPSSYDEALKLWTLKWQNHPESDMFCLCTVSSGESYLPAISNSPVSPQVPSSRRDNLLLSCAISESSPEGLWGDFPPNVTSSFCPVI